MYHSYRPSQEVVPLSAKRWQHTPMGCTGCAPDFPAKTTIEVYDCTRSSKSSQMSSRLRTLCLLHGHLLLMLG